MSSRRFAVLLPILAHDDGPRVLLMKRPERETDPYSGQVCLPGGALEVDDTSLLDCALREAGEELGIPAHSVEIISELQWMFFLKNLFHLKHLLEKNLIYCSLPILPVLCNFHIKI